MVNLFRPKTMRRMAVFMALVAPIVYLFGSLFFALNGAHGQEVFAEPVYVDEWVDVESYGDVTKEYRYVIKSGQSSIITTALSVSYPSPGRTISGSVFYLNGVRREPTSYGFSLLAQNYGESYSRLYSYPNTSLPFPLVDGNGALQMALPWSFSGSLDAISPIASFFAGGQWQVLESVPSSVVPENSGAYSDYIFKNFFAKDNFLVHWGENAISENPYGFAPFGYFWRYLDTNVLHLSNEQVGLMAYGYMYYAAHVLLFDVGFMLVTFFLSFIQKVGDKIGGEER